MGLGFNKGQETYTVIGSPTITNGVASNFATNAYLRTASIPDFTGDVELVVKFKVNSLSAQGYLMSWTISGYQCSFSIRTDGKLSCYFSRTGGSETTLNLIGNHVFTAGTDIVARVVKTSTNTLSLYYKDNGAWVLDKEVTNSNAGTTSIGSNYFRIGVNGAYTPSAALDGEIDLNETYIKTNGAIWFHEPREITGVQYNGQTVNKLLFNGVQVWPDIPRYNVGTPSFLMRFDGSFKYYSDGNITAELVNSPSLTTGGPWGLGALDQTYYAADTSVRKAVQVNMTAAQQTSQSFFIEYWARLDNTDQSIYQTFLGNIIHPDTTYSGWAFRWWPRTGGNISILDMFAGNGSSTVHHYNQLGYNQVIPGNTQQEWINCCEAVKNNWCHYGVYFNKQNTRVQFYINGRCFYEQSTTVYDTALGNAQPNFYISNAKYGTGYTLSPMAEVRVLLGQNADDYATTIQTGTHSGGYGTFDYTVPTASFADGGLTQYIAS